MTATATQSKPAPKPAAAQPARPASRLTAVRKERLRAPLRYFFYGDNGVGKSTLAAAAPDPIWLDIEDGSARLNVTRYPFRDGPGGHIPHGYQDIIAAIDDLTANPHSFQTLVIDTADKLESMIWKWMLERDSQPSARSKDGPLDSIESYGYGKGYNMAVDEWRALCVRLDRLRSQRGMAIILIAHSQVKAFKNPTGPDFDRYQPALHEKAGGFLKGWSDVVAFIRHEDDAGKAPGDRNARPKGFSTGRRLLMLSHSAAYDAKSRIDLPEEVEIDIENPWGPLAEAIDAGFENEIPKLVEAITAETTRIGDDELAAKVATATAAAAEKQDATTLSRFLADLKNRPSKTAEPQQ